VSDDDEGTVLYSPALHGGEVRIVPKRSRSKRKLRGATLKPLVWAFANGLLRRAPRFAHRGLSRGLCAVIQTVAGVPGNQLTDACVAMAQLSTAAGHPATGPGIYRGFLDEIKTALEFAAGIYHEGVESVADRMGFAGDGAERVAAAAAEHGGVMLCVTHNPGSIIASPAIARLAPTLLISKNPRTVARTRMALDGYERLGLKVLMVRSGNPTALTRACLRALRSGTVVVATVDRYDREPNRVELPVFGRPVGLAPWAARLAVKAKVPVIPAYTHAGGGRIEVQTGAAHIHTDTEEAMRHYMGYFEQAILARPSSWSFLADKRWRWHLQAAARAL
jgi:lauroyl/myristoyl acyltransferase